MFSRVANSKTSKNFREIRENKNDEFDSSDDTFCVKALEKFEKNQGMF